MDAIRWVFILIAIGSAAAVALWLSLSSPAASPPPTTEPAAVTALPMNPPAAASKAAPPSAVAARAASATAVSQAPARRPAARIGSEGYGPHIDRTLTGNEAAAAWEAVQWLRGCASTEQRRSSFEVARAQGVAPEMLTQMMQEVDAEARRCQTVTAEHRAMLPELASRAMRAGVPEAVSAFAATAFVGDLTPAQRQEVADAMRRDAQAGNAQGLLNAALANEAWGLSDAERLAFMHAYSELPDQPGAKSTLAALVKQGALRFKTPPTQAQLDAAKVDGQRILDRARTGRQP